MSGQGSEKGDPFASKTSGSANASGSLIGTSNSHGTSSLASGAISSDGFGSSTSCGSEATRSMFGFQQSDSSLLKKAFDPWISPFGSSSSASVEGFKRTSEVDPSVEKPISICFMPVYKDKSHEEIRWEDYQLTGKGGIGFSFPTSSSIANISTPGVPFTKLFTSLPTQTPTWNSGRCGFNFSTSPGLSPFSASSFANFSTPSWGTTSISTTPVHTPNPFAKLCTSQATETPTWNFAGPTQTSNSFTSQPLGFASFANTCSATVTAPPLNLFRPSVPEPLNHNPFTPFWSTQISGPVFCATSAAVSVSVAPVSSGLNSTVNQLAPFSKPSDVPSTQNCKGAIAGIAGQSSVAQLTEQLSSAVNPFGTIPPPVVCSKMADSNYNIDNLRNCTCTCYKHASIWIPESGNNHAKLLLRCNVCKSYECWVPSGEETEMGLLSNVTQERVSRKEAALHVLSTLTKVMVLITLLCVSVLILAVLYKM